MSKRSWVAPRRHLAAGLNHLFPLCSCTYEDDCRGTDWLSIADNFQQKMISIRVVQKNADQVMLTICFLFTHSHLFFILLSATPDVLCIFSDRADCTNTRQCEPELSFQHYLWVPCRFWWTQLCAGDLTTNPILQVHTWNKGASCWGCV